MDHRADDSVGMRRQLLQEEPSKWYLPTLPDQDWRLYWLWLSTDTENGIAFTDLDWLRSNLYSAGSATVTSSLTCSSVTQPSSTYARANEVALRTMSSDGISSRSSR